MLPKTRCLACRSCCFPTLVLLAFLCSCGPTTESGPATQARSPAPPAATIGELPVASIPQFVWLEGEQPSFTNVKLNLAGWGNKQFLSGEKWLHLSIDADKIEKELPSQGGLIRYDIDIKDVGSRAIWARIGFEFARSPFDWRIDGGPWTSVSPEELTSDLMEIDFFCEVAWLKLGQRELASGPHQLEFRLPKKKDDKGQYQRVLFALDAVCLCSGEYPLNGKFKPDEDGRDASDREAANAVFHLSETGPDGGRSFLPLEGL